MRSSATVLGGAALWSLLAVAAATLVAEVLTYGFAIQSRVSLARLDLSDR